jgi:hypothetical protein
MYEDYAYSGEVYSIDVDEHIEDEEVKLDEEVV